MLAGLQSETETLFPAIRGLAPTSDELAAGEQRARFGRIVRISGYKTEIFDMHVAKDRAAYNKRMLDLSRRAQIGTVRILVHDRHLLSRKDGSTGWFGYLEWMEYTRDGGDTNNWGGNAAKEGI